MITNLARRIVRLYPIAWRARYEREMFALLDETDVTFAKAFDLLGGALVEWAHVVLSRDMASRLLQRGWAKATFRFGVFGVSVAIGSVVCRGIASRMLELAHQQVPMLVAIPAVVLIPVQLFGLFRLQWNLPISEKTPKHRIGRAELLGWFALFLVGGVGQKMQQLTTLGWVSLPGGWYTREFSLLFGFSSLPFMALVPHVLDPWFYRATGQHIFGSGRRKPNVPVRPLGLE
jgi:hypothetical protein